MTLESRGGLLCQQLGKPVLKFLHQQLLKKDTYCKDIINTRPGWKTKVCLTKDCDISSWEEAIQISEKPAHII